MPDETRKMRQHKRRVDGVARVRTSRRGEGEANRNVGDERWRDGPGVMRRSTPLWSVKWSLTFLSPSIPS